MKQRSFASLSFDAKKKPTRREKFLGEMDKVVPWEALLALIEPSYPTSGRRGRPPMPAATMPAENGTEEVKYHRTSFPRASAVRALQAYGVTRLTSSVPFWRNRDGGS
jgi:hypothetical protein